MKNSIYEKRVLKRLSQQKVAELCHVTRQTINAIENEKYDPTLELAFKLASVFDTTVDELFHYRDDNEYNKNQIESENQI